MEKFHKLHMCKFEEMKIDEKRVYNLRYHMQKDDKCAYVDNNKQNQTNQLIWYHSVFPHIVYPQRGIIENQREI